ncbi:hypothetical protein CspeluHIS016_0406820 [Cutaneotrichosporon spelunceum]|uniref:Uncharacterized protein n=1 Tax=Cutaneotrichosporon spelunceum TaxID=1672016 RepID=A0AAD3YD62_9TREE|nr:hypothetical protein CspeluHIS016_0406820 [Cutaneotrichosporon spelunceum]
MDMSRSSSLFASDYSLTPTQSREEPNPSTTTPRPSGQLRQIKSPPPAPLPMPSITKKAPTPPSPRVRTARRDYPACMEAGISHETRAQALGQAGPGAERHLRAAAAHFETALALHPEGNAALRLATVLYHLSSHCRKAEAAKHLWAARSLATGEGPALEVRAVVCARLSALLRLLGDDLSSEAGEAAVAALDAFEDVAAEKMDSASSLSKADFKLEAPALAATFLALAEAAAAVSTLGDLDAAEPYTDLADHALGHAANMATLASAPALLTHIRIVGARIATDRLAFYARWADVNWDGLIADLATLASQTRDLARRLRGSRGAAAADQAAEAAKVLADARVMHASSLGSLRESQPPTPGVLTARSATFALSPVSVTLATPPFTESPPSDPVSGLVSSSGSWSSSTSSPPILEEPEEEEDLAPAIPDPASVVSTRKRAPPPPPLKFVQRSPRPLAQSLSPQHPPMAQSMSPQHPPMALSPLNPARQAMRPSIVRDSGSANSPHAPDTRLDAPQAQWNELAAAGKGYKLALSLLSSANLPQYDRARRKSDLLFAIAAAALSRSELASRLVQTPGNISRSGSGSYFSPTAAHASPESLNSLHQMAYRNQTRASTYPRSPRSPWVVPATPRSDPHSGTRMTGAAALRATAEVYAVWAAREVGWSAVIDPKGRVVDRRTGSAAADEAGLRAVLLALRVWWVRAVAGDGDDEIVASDEDELGEHPGKTGSWETEVGGKEESPVDGKEAEGGVDLGNHDFGVGEATARRIAGVLHRLRAEGAAADDVRHFVKPYSLNDDEAGFWAQVEDVLG